MTIYLIKRLFINLFKIYMYLHNSKTYNKASQLVHLYDIILNINIVVF
jgi:hypothetical protein